MPNNASEFICLFNTIDSLLRKKLFISEKYSNFFSIILKAKDSNIISKKQHEFLTLIGNLRNAIIHDDKFKFPANPIADPHDEVINQLKEIIACIDQPLKVQDLKASVPRIFDQEDCLFECIKLMREKDFSQVVVKLDCVYGLFTREDEARWLEHQATDGGLSLSLKDYKIRDLQSLVIKDQCVFIARTASVIELADLFQRKSRPEMAAILVTEHGKQIEKPIKIFTHWDLPEIMRNIESY